MKTSRALGVNAYTKWQLRDMVNQFRDRNPEISLRDICRMNGKHPKYISNRMSDPRQERVLEETYLEIKRMLDDYERKKYDML